MQEKVEGLILRRIRYGDSSLILKIFTRAGGSQSFIASVSKKARGKGLQNSVLQPLQAISGVAQSTPKSELLRLKEARLAYHYQSLRHDPVKNCLGLFLVEVLQYILRQEEPQPPLLDFLLNGLQELDQTDKPVGHFHLVFLMRLLDHLGVAPPAVQSGPYLDLQEGHFREDEALHPHWIQGVVLTQWQELRGLPFEDWWHFQVHASERRRLLSALLDYFRLHVQDFGELRSRKVLREVLA